MFLLCSSLAFFSITSSSGLSGIFPNDGFHVVCFGIVRILRTSLEIFEYEDDNGNERHGWENEEPVLCVQFANITKVSANKFQSENDNYKGGQIRLWGRFDRSVDEQLTFRMPFDSCYFAFLNALKLKLD